MQKTGSSVGILPETVNATVTPPEIEPDYTPNFVIIHSTPGPGAGQAVTPATGPDHKPPHSTREEIYATSQRAAEQIAISKYEGRPGVTQVFSLDKATDTEEGEK